MRITRWNRWAATASVALACFFGVGLAAQQTAPAPKGVPDVKGVSANPIRSIEGKDNFDAYCAVCHGIDGKGNGPAAPAMKAAVPDLTTIASRNGGRFDAIRLERVIKGTDKPSTPAHGIETMPIWGDVFRTEDPPRANMRVKNLVKYVESIQAGAGTGQQ